MNVKATDNDIVRVGDVYYKPFWLAGSMYFRKFYTRKIYRNIPIYLGEKKYADLSDLKNYFKENDIEIISVNKIS
jgi:hypothetical protein